MFWVASTLMISWTDVMPCSHWQDSSFVPVSFSLSFFCWLQEVICFCGGCCLLVGSTGSPWDQKKSQCKGRWSWMRMCEGKASSLWLLAVRIVVTDVKSHFCFCSLYGGWRCLRGSSNLWWFLRESWKPSFIWGRKPLKLSSNIEANWGNGERQSRCRGLCTGSFFSCKFHLVIVFRRSVWSHSDAVRHTLFRAFCFQTAEILKTYCCVNHFILPSYQTVCVTATDTLFIRTKTSHKQSSLLRSSVHWLLSRHSEYISGLLLWLLPYFFSWGLYR